MKKTTKTRPTTHKVRNTYDREPVQVYQVPGLTMTEQNHARACDINTIMSKYLKTGVMTHIKQYEPTYGDVSELDYQNSMDLVARVKSEYHDLPAYVRKDIGGESQYLALMQTDEGVATLQSILAPGEQYEKDGSPLTDDPEPPPAAKTETEQTVT